MTWMGVVFLAALAVGAGGLLLRNYLHLRSLDDETRGEIEDMKVRILKQDVRDTQMDPRNQPTRFNPYGD